MSQQHRIPLEQEVLVEYVNRSELAKDESKLAALMGLLVAAHYRTTPSDLTRILDAPNARLWIAVRGQIIIGAVLVFEEGNLPTNLASQVLDGRRRPRGHTLPCYLAKQPGLRGSLKWRHWRVARIAVAADERRGGVASELMEAVYGLATVSDVDVVGALFGATPDLLSFWRAVRCFPIHIGLKRGLAQVYRPLLS